MLVQAKEPFAVDVDGVQRVFNPEEILDDADPVVACRRGMFRALPGQVVESASAAPGEKRGDQRR